MKLGMAGLAATALPGHAGARGRATRFRNGLCATTFSETVFAKGIRYRAGKRTARNLVELERIMMEFGGNEFFSRTGTRRFRVGENYGFEGTIERARIARSLGLPLNPEFLLCASYGDVSGQPEPDFSGFPEIRLSGPWNQIGIEEMCDAFRIYGRIVARELLDTGVRVNIWDIGNEVELGIAGIAVPPFTKDIGGPGWVYKAPDAIDPEIKKMDIPRWLKLSDPERVAWGRAHVWPYVGKILAAMAEGIRAVDPKARFATHASGLAAQQPETFVAFHQAIETQGFKADQLGVSFYPTSSSTPPKRFELFKQAALGARRRLGRRVYIAEFGYAAGPMRYGTMDWANPVDGYPTTPAGQAAFLRDLASWGIENGVLSGIRPWAPDFIASAWQNMALFGEPVDGVASPRPGLAAIREVLASR